MVTGHAEQILRVDLGSGRIEKEPIPDQDVMRKYVGGTGLALYYLIKECPPDASAQDPSTPIIFMTGPLAGTRAPSSSNYVVVSLHNDVPYAAGAGHAHGFWAAFLKFAGYEGIIITGASESPQYLWINDDTVELRDATPYWGLGTRETERRIKQELGGEPDEISVACIGPAGEARLPGASIRNDRNHNAGKGSPGALLGAKNLKAIAVRGTGGVRIAEPVPFLEAVTQWEDNLFLRPEGRGPTLASLWHNGGMTRHHSYFAKRGFTAGKNLSDPTWSMEWSEKYLAACAEWRVDPAPSYNCTIACAHNIAITSGKFAGSRVSMCGGAEPFEGAASMIGVDDIGAALMLTDHYDDIGMESGFGGPLLGMAYEAFNEGIITLEDTEGLDLTWGNYESAIELLQQMMERRGFGGRLANGMKEAASAIGGGADQFLVHVKWAGLNIHDWRPLWPSMFGQVIAGTGPAHQTIGDKSEQLWQTAQLPDGKAETVRNGQLKKIWEDCTGVCMFACVSVVDVTTLAPQAVALAAGWEGFDTAEALAVGERTVNMMRLIALQRGFTKADDFVVSPRILEAPRSGPGAKHAMGPHLARMIDEYYELMGWDVETGRPTAATIERLDLGDVVEQLALGEAIGV